MTANASRNQWTVVVPGEQTNGRFAVIETRERPGAELPRHAHSREDEFIYVLEGQLTFDRDGEQVACPPGTWLFLPRGSEHAYSVESPEARLLVVFSPAGFEGCMRELARLCEPGAGFHVAERLVATAARYGVAITGPALSSGR